MMKLRWLGLSLAVGLASLAASQSLVSRTSRLDYVSVYGGGGDAFTPSDLEEDFTLESFDDMAMAFSDFKSGFILGNPQRPWSAQVSVEETQRFVISGPLNSFTSIESSGQTRIAASATGEGIASIRGGNFLEFDFDLDATRDIQLVGQFSLDPDLQNLMGEVTLRRFDGITWGIVFTTLFLPGQEGDFNELRTLTAGSYRLTTGAHGDAFAGARPGSVNNWNSSLRVVPEPATVIGLAIGGLSLLRRKLSHP